MFAKVIEPKKPGEFLEMLFLLLTAAFLGTVTSEVLIDLSKATLDEETGNFCVVQKVRQYYDHRKELN